jgi:uncharacterized protein involved in response to NO
MSSRQPGRVSDETRPRVARPDRSFAWYIGGSFATALAGGFALALLLPLAELAGWNWGVRWPALVQAHGHLQTVGWVGLFVTGMALRLAPRFAGRPLRFPSLTPVILALLLFALLGRAVAQPWLDQPGMHGLLIAGAAAELLAAALFAALIVSTVAPAASTLPVAPFFLLGALGFLAQAALAALWLPALTPSLPILGPQRDGVLLRLQFYGFLLPFIFAVSLRSLPAFFKERSPRPRDLWPLAVLLAAGVLLSAGATAAGPSALRARVAGDLLIAAAMLSALRQTGVWRQPLGLRPSARHAVLLIRTVYAWLLLAAVMLIAGSLLAFAGAVAPFDLPDALRHTLALGVFSTMIAAMAPLMLPWLAQRRQQQYRAERETAVLWALFTLATVLRVSGAFVEGSPLSSASNWLIATSGMLGIGAVLSLALTILSAVRRRPAGTVHPDEP